MTLEFGTVIPRSTDKASKACSAGTAPRPDPVPKCTAHPLIQAAATLRAAVQRLTFGPPVAQVYNPLIYAWEPHCEYLSRFGNGRKRVLFLGINPGPFGMAQTGVPFGEVQAVRHWMRIDSRVTVPAEQHPKRPVLGFACPRSEVSGRRLWGLFARRFGPAEEFFAGHFVVNYCPLLFLESSGCNRTPDKLPSAEQAPLLQACDEHLKGVVQCVKPEWVIGIGRFAQERARAVFRKSAPKLGAILHPSPASPASNHDWEGTVTRQLETLGIW